MITSSYSSLLSLSGPYFLFLDFGTMSLFQIAHVFFFSKIRFLFSSSINELFYFSPPTYLTFFISLVLMSLIRLFCSDINCLTEMDTSSVKGGGGIYVFIKDRKVLLDFLEAPKYKF